MKFFTYTAKNQEVILEAVRFRAHEGTIVRAHLIEGSSLTAEDASGKYLIGKDEAFVSLQVSRWTFEGKSGLNLQRVFRSAKAAKEFIESQKKRYNF